MKKITALPLCLLGVLLCLTGCGGSASKTTSLSVVYAVTTTLALLLLLGCALRREKRDAWMLLLFACVLIANIGYFALSISRELSEALLANRIAYLGSVFLPLCMMMGILQESGLSYRKWLPCVLSALGVVVFLIAASPGYLPIYYKEARLVIREGASFLEKVYGPWHFLYPVYLIGYFSAMVTCIIYAIRKNLTSVLPAAILAGMVLINIAVWLMEQFVSIEIELLSVSYILSELFLLCLRLLRTQNQTNAQPCEAPVQQENEQELPQPCEAPVQQENEQELPQPCLKSEDAVQFEQALAMLTKTERMIFDRYTQNASTKEIMSALNIKENTLKFHNKNIYGKFAVSSRKQLVMLYKEYLAGKAER